MEETNGNLLVRLQSADPEERRTAAEMLGQGTVSPEIVSALAERLCDNNKGVRDAVAHSLLVFRSTDVARAIAQYISDENIAVRNLAGELLIQLGPCAVEAVFPFLKDENPDARKFAVDLLGLIQNPGSVDRIAGLLNDINENVRYAAVEALGNLRNVRAVPPMMLLYSAEEGLRAPIAEAFGKIGGEEAADFLLRAIATEDSLVQFAIVEALGNLGKSQALYPLMDRLPEHTGEMRRVILRAIVGIVEQQGIELQYPETFETYFIEALADEEQDIRLSALRGLSQFSSRRALEAMIRQIGPDEEINQFIANVLHENPREAFRTVVETLEQEFEQSHLTLIQILATITQDIMQSREANPDDDDLLQLIDRAFEALLRLWGELSGEMRFGTLDLLMILDGERALPVVRDALTDGEPWVRIHSLELLEHVGDAQLREYLETATNDESDLVREFAQRSLERLTIPQ